MAQATAIRLTGDDLRIEDVWSVALEGASTLAGGYFRDGDLDATRKYFARALAARDI